MKRHPFSKADRRLLSVCTLAVVILAVGAGVRAWLGSLHSLPAVPSDKQNFPVPNGFDTLQAACKLYVPMPTPAVDRLEDIRPDVMVNGHVVPRHYSPTAREAWLHRNAPALALLRVGLTQNYLQPSGKFAVGLGVMPHKIARLLIVESHARALRHDWQGVAASGLDNVALSTKIPEGGAMFEYFMSEFVDNTGVRTIWDALPHLSPAQTKQVFLSLQAINAGRPTLRQTLEQENENDKIALFMLLRSAQKDARPPIYNGSLLWARVRWQFANFKLMLADQDKYSEKVIDAVGKPYGLHDFPAAPKNSLADPLADLFFTSDPQWYFNAARDKAARRLLVTTLALTVYRDKHGTYPTSLTNLAPAILKQVPLDPFGIGGPLIYRRHGAGYLLYSVGPDGHDDGGRPIDHPSTRYDRHAVDKQDRGDIVAGINR